MIQNENGDYLENQKQQQHPSEPNLVENLVRTFGYFTAEHNSQLTLNDQKIQSDLSRELEYASAHPESGMRTPEEIKKEMEDRADIAKQYLNQGTIHVNLEGIGEQTARYVIIRPPRGREDQRYAGRPVFVIPGISNDISGVESLLKEWAFQGRTVICVGQPESFSGSVSEQFVSKMEKATDLSMHEEFYKRSIRMTLELERRERLPDPDDRNAPYSADLFCHSAGCLLGAGILGDAYYQGMVIDAAFVAPAGVTKQTLFDFDVMGTARDILHIMGNHISDLPHLTRGPLAQPEDKERVTKSVKRIILRRNMGTYYRVQLANGHKIPVLSGDKDWIVKSLQAENSLRRTNESLTVISLQDASHAEALLKPRDTIHMIRNLWEKNSR